MRVLKYIGATVVSVVLLFAFVANFSAVESRFQCSGSLSLNDASSTATVYLRVERYRWWVSLWSDSDAAIWLEIPNQFVETFSEVLEVGDQLQIFGLDAEIKGNFSTLSHVLALQTSRGFFDGECKRINA